jgi:hypothetical protein
MDRAEVAAQRVARYLAQRTGQLHARRARSDDDERHPLLSSGRVGFSLRGFVGDQDPSPHFGGVLDRLEAGRKRCPVVTPEVGVSGAGRDNERVVVDRAAVAQSHASDCRIQPDRLAEQDARVGAVAKNRAQWLCDVAGR